MSLLEVSPEDVFNLPLFECFFVVDTRNTHEFEESHIVTARTCPPCIDNTQAAMDTFVYQELISNPPDNYKYVVIYGNSSQNVHSKYVLNYFLKRCKLQADFSKVLYLATGFTVFYEEFPFLTTKLTFPKLTPYPQSVPGTNGLFIGSRLHAHNEESLMLLGITHIVNATNNIANLRNNSKLTYLRCSLCDENTQSLRLAMDESFLFIKEALLQHVDKEPCNRVLVHCSAGVSRSASLVISYLLRSGLCCSYDEAFNTLKNTRSNIRPNPGFEQQLRLICNKPQSYLTYKENKKQVP